MSIPLTIMTLCRWIQVLNEKMAFLCYKCLEESNIFASFFTMILTFPEQILRRVTQILFTSELMLFLYIVATMGRTKELKSGTKAWAPFAFVLFISIVLGFVMQFGPNESLVSNYNHKGVHVILANTLVLLVIIFCQRFSCYSTSQKDEEETEGVTDLTQYKKCLRTASIVFTVVSVVPIVSSLIVLDFFEHYGQSIGSPSSNWLSHTLTLFEWLIPIFFALPTLICLPRYRTRQKERKETYVVTEEE